MNWLKTKLKTQKSITDETDEDELAYETECELKIKGQNKRKHIDTTNILNRSIAIQNKNKSATKQSAYSNWTKTYPDFEICEKSQAGFFAKSKSGRKKLPNKLPYDNKVKNEVEAHGTYSMNTKI